MKLSSSKLVFQNRVNLYLGMGWNEKRVVFQIQQSLYFIVFEIITIYIYIYFLFEVIS